jgi:hypothetical protein
MNCRNCGAPLNPHEEKCGYCESYWDLKKFGNPFSFLKNKSIRIKAIYPILIGVGFITFFLMYGFFFDHLSESILVNAAPLWYIPIVFGSYGYLAEHLIEKMVFGNATSFSDAYKKWLQEFALKSIFLALLAAFFFYPLRFFSKITPLKIALIGSLVWGFVLLVFINGIFPGL